MWPGFLDILSFGTIDLSFNLAIRLGCSYMVHLPINFYFNKKK